MNFCDDFYCFQQGKHTESQKAKDIIFTTEVLDLIQYLHIIIRLITKIDAELQDMHWTLVNIFACTDAANISLT